MRSFTTDWEALPQDRRPGRPLFAIGDVHGHSDALAAQLDHLRGVIAESYPGETVDLVYLGDYVDRGPDPVDVLELVADGLGLPQVQETALLGNHDWMLMASAGVKGLAMEIDDWAVWISNGGRETLSALGEADYRDTKMERIRARLGPKALGLLERLTHSFRSGDILCVHAGVDPDRPLNAQRERDILWIRDSFLRPAERNGPWPPEVTVVHGHTPNAFGIFAHRVGVDTGGYASNVFTAVEITPERLRFHHTRR